ncbi:MMPL family transporter [Micromonospora sp. MS34]|uniref:MMPL family transporter n=1 Tax=Micromonospora sp. MS34 TaxID=3385971 RepID=UPI0039A25F0E
MWRRWARFITRARWSVVAAAVALLAVGAGWGSGVFAELGSGGFADPGSQSASADRVIRAELGGHSADLIVLYESRTATVDDAEFRASLTAAVAALRQRPEVDRVVSYYDTRAPSMVSRDRHATYAVVTLRARTDTGKLAEYETLRAHLQAPGLTSRVGGVVAVYTNTDDITKQDVTRGEAIAMPAVLILLLFVFGSVVAAAMPLLVGGLAVLAGLTITRLITMTTDVSTFAANALTLLGLGMAVDYSLFVISRFRDELRAGRHPREAIGRTLATAGRTVLVSGLTVMLALSSLLIFPEMFLRSMGIGGIVAVGSAMAGALTVLPALLVILGPRVDAGRMPWLRHRSRRALNGDQPVAGTSSPGIDGVSGRWARVASSVTRRPVSYLTAVFLVLLVLAAPLWHARFAGTDERVLPAGDHARVVSERIATDFPGGAATPIEVVVRHADAAAVTDLADRVAGLPGVTGVRAVDRARDTTLLTVGYIGEATGNEAYRTVHAIRALPAPDGATVLVGGQPARDVDLLASLRGRLPWMAAIMAGVTLVLLFLAFGSVLLPVKAVLLNVLSLSASFGVVVWGFQDGHLADAMSFTAPGFIEPTVPIFLLAVLFGLATDYEVFLLSRVREAWDATGNNTRALTVGLQRTGGIITAAALLLIVVVAGFATGRIVFTKLIGVGMITAIVVDATLVRILLVPATMRLLGRWNWWAPGPLARVYRRVGIQEGDPGTPVPCEATASVAADPGAVCGP